MTLAAVSLLVRMKLKISFTVGGIPIADMEEVNTFPAGLFIH